MAIRFERAGIAALAVLLFAASVHAQAGATVKTVGEFLRYDAKASAVVVKVTDPGGAAATGVARGSDTTFAVKPEGSVLSKTTVTIDGKKAELGDIAAGRIVHVYWRPDEADASGRFARKIDVVAAP